MAAPFSNVIATLTIQDQDILNAGLANLVNRVNASVTFPATTGVFYAGYTVITSVATTIFNALNVPFVYVRNANPTGNAQMTVSVSGIGIASTAVIDMSPGGIFLIGNPTLVGATLNPGSGVNLLSLQAPGSTVIAEWLYAL